MATQKVRTGDIQVRGLKELNKALKDLPDDLHKELPRINREAAGIAADQGRSNALALGGVAAKTAPSIKLVGGARSAGVGFGGVAYPWAGGAEFGAGQNIIRTRKSGTYLGYNQFEPWKGNGPTAGYFIYPAIREKNDEIVRTYEEGLEGILKQLFPDKT